MSEEQPAPSGPIMLVATNMMRPPPTRIGKIGSDFVLPRTVPVMSLLTGAIGMIVGLIITIPFGNFQTIAIGAILGALAGVAAATMSPIKGESFAKWLGLTVVSSRQRRVEINGKTAKVYIGIAPLSYTAGGVTRMVSGAANVALGSVDERGVLINHSSVMTERRKLAAEVSSTRGGQWVPPGEVRSLPAQRSSSSLSVAGAKKPRTKDKPEEAPRSLAGAAAKVSKDPRPAKAPKESSSGAPGKTRHLPSSSSKPLTPRK